MATLHILDNKQNRSLQKLRVSLTKMQEKYHY
uniref:Uncharacterized protein n=1 Tax=Rhizophora mucronata TaxID=61149 RepID=A0A2P2N5K9_RHIMU